MPSCHVAFSGELEDADEVQQPGHFVLACFLLAVNKRFCASPAVKFCIDALTRHFEGHLKAKSEVQKYLDQFSGAKLPGGS